MDEYEDAIWEIQWKKGLTNTQAALRLTEQIIETTGRPLARVGIRVRVKVGRLYKLQK